MENKKKFRLFLVDDDPLFLKVLEFEFIKYPEFVIEPFATGELCIKHQSVSGMSQSGKPDLIVLDYHLDAVDKNAMNGLQILQEIKRLNPDIPVIMISSQD